MIEVAGIIAPEAGLDSGTVYAPSRFDPMGDIHDINARFTMDDLWPRMDDERFAPGRSNLTLYLAEGTETVSDGSGRRVVGLNYTHSGNLEWQNTEDQYEMARRKARKMVGTIFKPAFYEELYRILTDDPDARLVHMLTGIGSIGVGGAKKSFYILGTEQGAETRKVLPTQE